MFIISLCLKKISYGITAPIIELSQNIQKIIDYNIKEKAKLIED